MISLEQAKTLQGKTMIGADGDKLGTIDTLYADREDGSPTFATVKTGLFGSRTSFVPLDQAELEGDDLVVPYAKDLVKDDPGVDPDSELSPEEEDRLYTHYSMGGDTSGPNTDDGRAKLRKYATTETETETGQVPVSKEQSDADGVYPQDSTSTGQTAPQR